MSVFRPTYRDKKTGSTLTAKVWWYEFTFAGKRIRESAKTTRKSIATESERRKRLDLEKTLAGMPLEKRENRINTVGDMIKVYSEHYPNSHREKSALFSAGRLGHVSRLLGATLLPHLTEDAIRRYIKTRLDEGVSGRTINMEVGELSRAIGQKWSIIWPKVRKLEERKDVGKALSSDEEKRLLEACDTAYSPLISPFVRTALLTGMRAGEIISLTWGQVNFADRVVTVGRAKTSSGTGRQIPMNQDLFAVLTAHAAWFTNRFGEAEAAHYLFPFGKPTPADPTRHITDITSAWHRLRDEANVSCRLHDLRHTAATKMAEAAVPESTMLSLIGHMSRAMLERYSHIRMASKREAVEALASPKRTPISNGIPQESPKVSGSQTIQ